MNKKYQIIYADPPWHFQNFNDETATKYVGNHYSIMKIDDICRLPINQLCDNGVLLMWVTAPMLPQCLDVIKAWGFEYKTKAFCWVKQNKSGMGIFTGMGYYTRSNSEDCLLATKGDILPRHDHSISQIVLHPVMEHSKKPPIIRDMIVRLFGDLPRIELFARQKVEGWDSWGNEILNDVELSNSGI